MSNRFGERKNAPLTSLLVVAFSSAIMVSATVLLPPLKERSWMAMFRFPHDERDEADETDERDEDEYDFAVVTAMDI